METTRILFVCLGNIIRSPLAEHMFRHQATQYGVMEKYEVDSAGTGGWHVGESPDPRMVRVAAGHGLHYDGAARQIRPGDLDKFDFIFAMDRDNQASLLRLARDEQQRSKIHLLREFDPLGGAQAAVPDPYYEGVNGFEETYQIVERSCQGLLEALEDGSLAKGSPTA